MAKFKHSRLWGGIMINRNIWFTSDTHFGHSKIIEYCHRPFKNVHEMDMEIIRRWNSKIKKRDLVFHLGDFSLCGKDYATRIVSQLNGEIRLIKGNHDRHGEQWFRDIGIAKVYDYPIVFEDFIVLSHEPMPFIPSAGMINLHGHIHDSLMYETWGNRCACMCVERHDYYPVHIKEIAKHYSG